MSFEDELAEVDAEIAELEQGLQNLHANIYPMNVGGIEIAVSRKAARGFVQQRIDALKHYKGRLDGAERVRQSLRDGSYLDGKDV